MNSLLRLILARGYMNEADGGSPGGGAPAASPAAAPSPAPAAAPSPAPAASPSPAPSSSTPMSEQDISSMLNFDPFNPPDDSQPPAAGGATTPPDPGTQPAAPGTPPAQPAAAPQLSPEMVAMKKQLDEATALLQQLRNPQPPAQPQPGQPPADDTPEYGFQIPDQLLAALDSEDPQMRRQGVSALMQGTARTVHKTVMAQAQSLIGHMVEAIPQVVAQQVQRMNYERTIFEDFYGTYKDLNIPELRPTIMGIARDVMQANPNAQWSAQVRDEIGRRAYAILGRQIPGQPQPQPVPFVAGGGARPAPEAPNAFQALL